MSHVDMQAARDRIVKVCSWIDGKNGDEDHSGGDVSGHGTHIASIILDIAPNADLYVARITKTRHLSERQADQIAKALFVARSVWRADIISMSFGFIKGIPNIEAELSEAIKANILIFAAASNDGGNSGRTYPAWRNQVLCIHSTDGYGNKSPYNPTPKDSDGDSDNFCIIGQHIKSAWPDPNQPAATKRMSGTSFATPVAVGLAAVILEMMSASMEKSFIKLRSYDGIRRVFKLMAQERDKGYSYISPFEFLGRSTRQIQEDIWTALNPAKS